MKKRKIIHWLHDMFINKTLCNKDWLRQNLQITTEALGKSQVTCKNCLKIIGKEKENAKI